MKIRNILLSLTISLFFFGAMQAGIVKVTVNNTTDVPIKMLLRKTGYIGAKYGITMISRDMPVVKAKQNKVCEWVFVGAGKKFGLYVVVEDLILRVNPKEMVRVKRFLRWKSKKKVKSGDKVVFPRDFNRQR